jgi:hypothetical protein
MIVVDPHAFKRLWPVLGVWLVLFVTAGDGFWLLKRQYILRSPVKVSAIITAKVVEPVPRLNTKRNIVYFRYPDESGKLKTAKEPVGSGWSSLHPGHEEPARLSLGVGVALEDDRGYTRFKGLVFGGGFLALWLWALGRYRFG